MQGKPSRQRISLWFCREGPTHTRAAPRSRLEAACNEPVQALGGRRRECVAGWLWSAAALTRGRRSLQVPPPAVRRAQQLRVRAETEAEKAAAAAEELELDNPESESARKKAEADRLRAAEKFMVIGTGEATCKNCGYEYTPAKGDPEYPISKGTQFQQLPDDWQCPTCGAEKRVFVTKQRQVGSRRCPSFTRLTRVPSILPPPPQHSPAPGSVSRRMLPAPPCRC